MEHSIDREKVIKAIDICLGHGKCNDCNYRSGTNYSDQDCRGRMLRDALALLKEQPEIFRCKDCKWAEVSDNEHTWCDHVDHEFCHNNDWFCADGERREYVKPPTESATDWNGVECE